MPHVLVGLVNQAAIQFAEDNLQTCNPFLRAASAACMPLQKRFVILTIVFLTRIAAVDGMILE